MAKNSDWDLDYSAGKAGENIVDGVVKEFVSGTIEVKTDRRWNATGNLYIETECFYQTSQQWEPSGLSVSKSTHYAFVLEGLVMVVPTEVLKHIVKVEGTPISTNIEPNPSKGFLIKPEHILWWYRYAKKD